MEKIIVYKKDGFKECSNHYSWLCVKLQELSRLVVEAGSTPTMERLQMLLKLRENQGENQISAIIPGSSTANLEARATAIQKISGQIQEIRYKQSSELAAVPVSIQYFSVDSETGLVSLDPEYMEDVESRFAERIDTPVKAGIYSRYLSLKEALEALNKAAKEAPRRELTEAEKRAKERGCFLPPEFIEGFNPEAELSLVRFNRAGEIEPDGRLFGYFK